MEEAEIQEGIEHENREHKDITKGDKKIAYKIAASHLKEDPKYYTHLSQMEDAVKKRESIKKAIEKEEEDESE